MDFRKFAVIVTIDLFPGRRDDFMPILLKNAVDSLELEPGCSRFDVLTPTDSEQVVLYEVYDSQAAFEIHLSTPHFRQFDTSTRTLVQKKSVQKLALHLQATD